MHLRVTSDANADSGVSDVVIELSGPLRQSFVDKDYGLGLAGLIVVLMCRNPGLSFERRLKFARKDKSLYLDIMLDLEQMQRATPAARKSLIAERLIREIPEVVNQFGVKVFDLPKFLADLESWFKERGICTSVADGEAKPEVH